MTHEGPMGGGAVITSSHSGPSFGPFVSGASVDIATGSMDVEVRIEETELPAPFRDGSGGISSQDLRQLAADALAAAEWLEAVR